MTSVIIPAHNESKVIASCLGSLLEETTPNIEIIVVCNGCTDDTRQVAEHFLPRIKFLETSIASKSAALNLGDKIATSYPRVYLDADVRLTAQSLKQIEGKLDEGFLAVAPQPKMDFEGSPWTVRAYYDVWLSLPFCKAGMIGSGVYALSKEGRARFDRFPDLIADDGYVRALFQAHERTGISEAFAIVRAPRSIKGLVRIKTRSRLGRYQLRHRYPDLVLNEKNSVARSALFSLSRPNAWPSVVVYLAINIYSRLRAAWQFKQGSMFWERDETTR